MGTDKIPATEFKILWSESAHADEERVFKSWAEIGRHIRYIAQYAPVGGPYDKTKIRITFADGATYESRLDIQHFTMPMEGNDNDLARHIRQFLSFHAGTFCPSHMTNEDYQSYLNSIGEESQAASQQYLETYDIPKTDGTFVNATVACCESCSQVFEFTAYSKLCGRCEYKKQQRDAEIAKREAERIERESDPLWPTYLEGRTAITKKMRQLLRQRSGKSWSVRGGRGTGWGWLTICAPPSRMDEWKMTEEDQEELSDLLGKRVHCQGESVSPDSHWHYLKACRGDFQREMA